MTEEDIKTGKKLVSTGIMVWRHRYGLSAAVVGALCVVKHSLDLNYATLHAGQQCWVGGWGQN